MQKILTQNSVKSKAILAVLGVAASVALPQVFHALGAISGLGTSLGSAFLPMHIPVILAGLLAGPVVGAIVGLVSPLLSFSISGMPVANMLVYMMIELAAYGAVSGWLKASKMPIILKVLIAQIAGRIVRSLTIVVAVFAFSATTPIAAAYSYLLSGVFGVALQLVLIPLILHRILPKAEEEKGDADAQ